MKEKILKKLKNHPILFSVARFFSWPYLYFKRRKARENILEEGAKICAGSIVECSYFGYYSGCNRNCNIMNTLVGRYVNIGPNVVIGQRNHIYQNFTTHDFIYHGGEHIRQYTLFESGGGQIWRKNRA